MKDIQGLPDTRNVIIDAVGVKDVQYPIRVSDKQGYVQHTVGNFNMYVELPAETKGTNMSRFLEVLHTHGTVVSVATFVDLAKKIRARLESDRVHLETEFVFFKTKVAPVSKIESLLDYKVTLGIELGLNKGTTEELDWDIRKVVRVEVPVTSLCPCSKEISKYGAHNQRSTITIEVASSELIWVDDLIEIAESSASCELYGLLKRPDEKYVTERAYENPKFVEDMVRDVALKVAALPGIQHYKILCENFESIHNHSAFARICR